MSQKDLEETEATSHLRGTRLRALGVATASAVAALSASEAIELFINRVVRPDAAELAWISESIMATAFLVMTTLWVGLRQTRSELSASERARLTVDTQLSIAASVQRALLPPIPAPVAGVSWFAAVEPAGKIGGDYYDFLPLANGQMCVVLGDVSGKGIGAAVFLSNVRAIVRALVRETAAPGEVLERLSETVLSDANGATYVTCILGVVDPACRTFTYSNAGHPAGVLVRESGVRGLGIGGPPVGLLQGSRYQEEVVSFGEGDIVVLVSDGVTEALDVGGEAVATTLAAVVERQRPSTPEQVSRALLKAAREGSGPHGVGDWADDRTVVAFGIPREPALGAVSPADAAAHP